MAGVKIDKFGGIAPRQHPTQLADGMAVTAHNCRLKIGKLVPLRQPQAVAGSNIMLDGGLVNIADARSIHVWRKADGTFDFVLFKGMTWTAPGNVADDTLTRMIVSGDRDGDGTVDEPVLYIRTSQTVRDAVPIIKKPMPAPHVVRNSGQTDLSTTENIRYTYFFVTWIDKYGMESPVSAPSQVKIDGQWKDGDLEYLDGDNVTITNFGTAETYPDAVKLRIYKIVTGTESETIQFVTEEKVTDSLWKVGIGVKVKDENAGETMPEIEAPPSDLQSILDVPGSYYCGFAPSLPKTVCFSDVNLLYSWPLAYRYDVRDNIVALAVTSNSVFALTDGWPYVLNGTLPESMTVTKLAGPAACVSQRGVAVYKNAVYYASNAGLMCIYNDADEGTVCTNVTDKIFTKDQWLALNPETCVMGQHDGALFLFFETSGGSHSGLVVDLTESSGTAVTTHDEAAKCLCVDDREDKMYYVREMK